VGHGAIPNPQPAQANADVFTEVFNVPNEVFNSTSVLTNRILAVNHGQALNNQQERNRRPSENGTDNQTPIDPAGVQKRCLLKILQANVDVLTNKKDELLLVIRSIKPDVLCLQEVLPKNPGIGGCIPEVELKLPGYSMHKADEMRRGTITYIADHIPAEQIPLTIPDSVACRLHIDGKTFLLCNIYRSPTRTTAEDDAALRHCLSSVCKEKKDGLIICGDFNHPGIDWDSQSAKTILERQFIEFVQEQYLTQHVRENTRFREGHEDSLLDLILTDRPSLIGKLDNLAPLGKSDHCILSYELDIGTTPPAKEESYRYYRGNYARMREEMAETDWDYEMRDLSANQAWTLFEEKLSASMERNIPKAKPQPRREKWLTKEAERAVKNKQRCRNRHQKRKTPTSLDEYKRARNQATRICREARADYEREVCLNIKDNPKEFWGFVRNQTEETSKVAPIRRQDGTLATSAEEKANLLSSAFASVFCREDMNNFPSLQAPDQELLAEIAIEEKDIIEEIQNTKKGKSAGPDGIHPCVIRELCKEVSRPLLLIFRKSLEEGQLPTKWKDAIVVPIFKKGSRHDPGNYRPVSLTSVCGKILEKIVRKHILKYLERTDYFCQEQYGFRPRRSCSSQLLCIVEEWTEWLDNRIPFDCVYLDYRKAFDSVPHHRLLQKVKASGLDGRLLEWIGSFLSNRTQRVRVDEATSGEEMVTSGIPQGSVLGPGSS
jgi:exonuclease III